MDMWNRLLGAGKDNYSCSVAKTRGSLVLESVVITGTSGLWSKGTKLRKRELVAIWHIWCWVKVEVTSGSVAQKPFVARREN